MTRYPTPPQPALEPLEHLSGTDLSDHARTFHTAPSALETASCTC